jgi:hypothetical protein
VIFLIEYDAAKGQTVNLFEFKDEERSKAQEQRLSMELDLLHGKVKHEVVTLEARSKESLAHSHARYFKSSKEMTEDFIRALESGTSKVPNPSSPDTVLHSS